MKYDGIICFSCGDWWYHNRGHFDMQLMRRYSSDLPILYVNAMGMRFPAIRDGRMFATRIVRKLRSVSKGLTKYASNFYVFSPFSVPLYSRHLTRRANAFLVRCQVRLAIHRMGFKRPLIWVVSPPAIDVIRKLRRAFLIYQRTDDFREFPGVNRGMIAQMDEELIRVADLVLHVNRRLHEDSLSHGANSFLTSHGVDYELFAITCEHEEEPPDIAAIKRPRIGFYGGIDSHTFDVTLLRDVAKVLPDLSFVLIGQCSLDASSLSPLPNVHFLGQKPYQTIPSYGRAFDVAIMPWHQNTWIDACNPVKLKEYLALGKPVVSTPYPQGHEYRDVVYFAKCADEFASAIRRALLEDCAAKRAARVQRVADQTWDALAEDISEVISNVIDSRNECNVQ